MHKLSTPSQRQQTKWVVFGVTALIIYFIMLFILTTLNPDFTQANSLASLFAEARYFVATIIIPLSIAFSILRYRLWDIDRLINRTLVYGTLTAILALIYFGGVILLQHLVNVVTGKAGQSPLIIVGSTLVIVALFQPLRRRIQRIIDRRFYRSKYDAARTVAAFSATLRQEVDLNQLREQVLPVVQETMQPAHVSLWLRSPERRTGDRHPAWNKRVRRLPFQAVAEPQTTQAVLRFDAWAKASCKRQRNWVGCKQLTSGMRLQWNTPIEPIHGKPCTRRWLVQQQP